MAPDPPPPEYGPEFLAWLRQTGPHRQLGAFAAPEYSHGADYAGHEFTEWSGYAGVIGINWTSDNFAWAYGGVAEFSPDRSLLFPYLGCYWQPTPHWSVAAILPWPSVSSTIAAMRSLSMVRPRVSRCRTTSSEISSAVATL